MLFYTHLRESELRFMVCCHATYIWTFRMIFLFIDVINQLNLYNYLNCLRWSQNKKNKTIADAETRLNFAGRCNVFGGLPLLFFQSLSKTSKLFWRSKYSFLHSSNQIYNILKDDLRQLHLFKPIAFIWQLMKNAYVDKSNLIEIYLIEWFDQYLLCNLTNIYIYINRMQIVAAQEYEKNKEMWYDWLWDNNKKFHIYAD